MLSRIKWTPVVAVLVGIAAVVLAMLDIDPYIAVTTGLLGLTLAIVARDSG